MQERKRQQEQRSLPCSMEHREDRMAKCIDCGTETKKTVYEPNVNKQVPLCDYCKDSFYRRCKICGQYYELKEIDTVKMICNYCKEA